MAWTEDIYPHFTPYDPHAFQILPAPQQPPTILQQLPATVMPPGSAASIRPGGHVKQDLVELMMIQNAQMHQVIMNNMTMSALSSFGFCCPPSGHMSQAPSDLRIIQETVADQEIYHHYYQPAPYVSCPAWFQCQTTQVYQDPNNPTSSLPNTDRPTVPPPPPPPPPPPSTSGPVGANVTPAAGKSDHTSAPSQQPISTTCSCEAKGAS
uniref:proline-rich protein 29-like n=1 Tax=Scatophagus argus TaxID=75038 RepID=UPI001ED7EF50|nr:proline-rich protein 29-like [Scatophagus argus]